MTTEKFVNNVFAEKEDLLKSYLLNEEESHVGILIKSMKLDAYQLKILKEVLDGALTDGFYTILLGLDGAARLGEDQHEFKLLNEEGHELTGGDLEATAWEIFHGE